MTQLLPSLLSLFLFHLLSQLSCYILPIGIGNRRNITKANILALMYVYGRARVKSQNAYGMRTTEAGFII